MDISRLKINNRRQDQASSSADAHGLPLPGSELWALFLDVDGTLSDIAPTPSEAFVPDAMLVALHGLKSGALALISGREIASIDAMTQPYRFAASGQHGFEIRKHPDAPIVFAETEDIPLQDMFEEAELLAAQYPGLVVERKSAGMALHFRNAPESELDVIHLLRRLVAQFPQTLCLQEGKLLGEIRQKHVNKGTAIESLMSSEPFFGRKPVFLGDDITDEIGFNTVNEMGGVTVKIGAGPTHAKFRLPAPADARQWLTKIIATLK